MSIFCNYIMNSQGKFWNGAKFVDYMDGSQKGYKSPKAALNVARKLVAKKPWVQCSIRRIVDNGSPNPEIHNVQF